jgi:radical SAM superfamily enzyme YgiQ (UPF0313 family)
MKMLNYHEPVYRPPSEGNNLIIQATWGCSFNKCTFCAMYKDKHFVARPLEDVFSDIEEAAKYWPEAHRVFLADGDAMVLPTADLMKISQKLTQTFPNLQRISTYAMPSNLLKKSPQELSELKENKLSLIYTGIESGNDAMLRKIKKGATAKSHIEGINKAIDAGMKVSTMVILGLAGTKYWKEHIDDTAKLINEAPPTYLSTLALRLYENTVDNFISNFGDDFEMQDDEGMLLEIHRLVEQINCKRPIIFRSNHASNALALKGNLPKDNARLLAEIEGALRGEVGLRPKFWRGL